MSSPVNTLDENPWRRRLRWLSLAALLGYWLTLIVATHIPTVPQTLEGGDKYQHFVAYGGLALLAAVAWSLRAPFGWQQTGAVLALVALQGALDEVTQPPFGRHADVADWLADTVGAMVGLAIFWAARTLVRLGQSLMA